jgi:cytoskeletal protein CcmA (bactofilin family)
MLFGKKKPSTTNLSTTPVERVTTVLGPNINWKGDLRGKGGVRIEGTLEGEIEVRGMVIIGETGRVTCEHVKADTVIVAGAVNGQITSEKLEIRSTGRVFGDVTTKSFSTEEGAFLRGKITMEDKVDLDEPATTPQEGSTDATVETDEGVDSTTGEA